MPKDKRLNHKLHYTLHFNRNYNLNQYQHLKFISYEKNLFDYADDCGDDGVVQS